MNLAKFIFVIITALESDETFTCTIVSFIMIYFTGLSTEIIEKVLKSSIYTVCLPG